MNTFLSWPVVFIINTRQQIKIMPCSDKTHTCSLHKTLQYPMYWLPNHSAPIKRLYVLQFVDYFPASVSKPLPETLTALFQMGVIHWPRGFWRQHASITLTSGLFSARLSAFHYGLVPR